MNTAEIKKLGTLSPDWENGRNIYDIGGICPTLTAGMGEGGGCVPMIIQKRLGNIYGDDRGTGFAGNVWDSDGLAPTITTQQGGNREPMIVDKPHQQDNLMTEDDICITECAGLSGRYNVLTDDYVIRKLTPRECFRLMGVKDEDSDKITVSNSQKYKMSGNSIVVDVLMAIFENMFTEQAQPKLSLF